MTLRTSGWWFPMVLAALAALAGCGDDDTVTTCTTSDECPAGWICLDHVCRQPGDVGDGETIDGADGDGDGDEDGTGADGDADDGGTGIPCAPGSECQDDMQCGGSWYMPWGEGEFDPACVRAGVPGPVRPSLQCT